MGWKDLDGDDAVQARVPRGTLLPCLQRRAAPRFRTGRGECQRSVPQWRGLYLLKPSVGITLVFATEGRIPPLKRLFIKEAGVAIANGLKAVNPGCYLAWLFRRLCPNCGFVLSAKPEVIPPGWQIAPDNALLAIQSLPSPNGSLPCCYTVGMRAVRVYTHTQF